MMQPKAQILIVEDSKTQATRLRYLLQEQGWQVAWAPSADAAMEAIVASTPDLILLDFYLPGVRGDELCRRIRMNMATRSIPVIMLTADEQDDIEMRGLDSGADNFIAKSVDQDVLLARIRNQLQRRSEREFAFRPAETKFLKARLLTIDDSATFLEHLRTELEADGYDVEQATSGAEGLRRVEQDEFDCVLVDLVMPGLDGIEVCRRISELRTRMASPVPVLMLTGKENKEDLTRALGAGADDFVGKSSEMAVLKGRIRALLRRKSFQDENQRIQLELKEKELEAVQARTAKEAAEARAILYEELEATATELKRSKRELLVAIDAAQEANQAKSAFLANMSHEIRTPMNGIIGMTELLFSTDLSKQQQEFLGMIQQSAHSLLRLINDILDFSKIEAGMLELELAEFDLREQLENTIQTLSVRAAQKSLELALQIAPDVPHRVVGDSGRLCQVIINLVGNAIKFTEKGEVAVGVHVESLTDENIRLHFRVRDTGIGISKEDQARVFEAFRQADNSMSRRFGGTGLGLAISAQLVEMMRGKLAVESELDVGTTLFFSAEFRLAEERDDEDAGRDEFKDVRVAVAVESETNREIVLGMLRQWGVQPAFAGDVQNLLEHFTAIEQAPAPVDLLLLDAGQEWDAIDILQDIAAHGRQTAFLFRSLDQSYLDDAFKAAGAVRIISKPFKQSTLLDALMEVLDISQFGGLSAADCGTTRKCTSPLRILLAEDNLVNQQVALRMLDHLGHQVTLAKNGKEAVEAFSQDAFDLVLMDVQMPEMNGYEATALVQRANQIECDACP